MKKYIIVLGLVFWGILGLSQNVLTPELLWKFGRVGEVVVSPDGNTMVYSVKHYNVTENKGNADLFVMALGDKSKGKGGKSSKAPLKVTSFSGSEFNPRWRPDGKRIGFLSSEGGTVQLWEVNPDGTDLVKVTNFQQGISNFSYSPKGTYISFTMDVKLDKTVNDLYADLPKANARIIDDLMYRHWNQWHDYSYSHVFYAKYENGKVAGPPIDIMENEKFDSPLNPFGGADQITWLPNESGIVYTCKKLNGKEYAVSTNSQLFRYNLQTKNTKELTTGMKGYDMEPVFSPDGSQLAWTSMKTAGFESDRNRIFVMDMTSNVSRELTVGFDQSSGHLAWSADRSKIYFVSAINATYQLFEIEVSTGKTRQITKGVHNFQSVAVAGDKLIAKKQSMSSPTEIFSVDPKTGVFSALTEVNAEIMNSTSMGQVTSRMIKTTDGKDMLTWVITPPNFDPSKKYPTLLYCQGGPQSAVSQFFSYRWNFQLMTANGYVIVAPNRRGLPSFGQAWNDQISGDWGGQAMKDYLSAIDAVSNEPWVDKERLGAVGASFGGYSVYYLAGNHQKRFKTFISHCGLFNLESWYGTTEEMFFANFDLKGAYWDPTRQSDYEKFSPHKYVKNWDTPIMVIHGEKDFRVPIGEGMQAFSAAQLQDIPSRFLYFPEEGHWVQSPQNGLLWHRVFFDWLDKWLK